MRKFTSILLIAVLLLALVAFTSCGSKSETKDNSDTEAVVDVSSENTSDTAEADTEEDTTEEIAEPVKEGSIDISGLVSVEMKDGWYSEEGLDETWNEVVLVNDSIEDFMAEVTVSVSNVYGGEGAEAWADNINGNYGGVGTVETVDINGHTYYHLYNVVDDNTQNMYFTDLDEGHYLEVSIMYMAPEKGMPVFDLLTFNS